MMLHFLAVKGWFIFSQRNSMKAPKTPKRQTGRLFLRSSKHSWRRWTWEMYPDLLGPARKRPRWDRDDLEGCDDFYGRFVEVMAPMLIVFGVSKAVTPMFFGLKVAWLLQYVWIKHSEQYSDIWLLRAFATYLSFFNKKSGPASMKFWKDCFLCLFWIFTSRAVTNIHPSLKVTEVTPRSCATPKPSQKASQNEPKMSRNICTFVHFVWSKFCHHLWSTGL